MVCIEWGWQWYKNHLMSAIIICMISDINQQSLRKIKVAKEFSLKKKIVAHIIQPHLLTACEFTV